MQAEPDAMDEPDDATTASTPVSNTTDHKTLSHAELKAVYEQSVAAESKKLENKRRALAAKRKKLEAEEAALYDQDDLSGEEDK